MKKIRFLVGALAIMTLMSTAVFASEVPQDTHISLQDDIAIINEISADELEAFLEENAAWLESVNVELENYLMTYPEEERSDVIKDLQGFSPNARSSSSYFEWHSYTWRGGYWTYNMYPNMSTRLLRPLALAGWYELNDEYGYLGSLSESLANQYFCHFDAFIEFEWNIERGRPDVSYAETILKLCNPT